MQELLAQFAFVVTYTPLPDEPTPPSVGVDTYVIPQLADQDPIVEAALVTELSKGQRTGLLIPGTRFDVFGTRHGRGGGWYDRLLANVPAEWTRIGITKSITSETLQRESWDEPVDYLLILGAEPQVIETHAR